MFIFISALVGLVRGKLRNLFALSSFGSVLAVAAIVIGCAALLSGAAILVQRIVDASESNRVGLPEVQCGDFETWEDSNRYFVNWDASSESTHALDSNGNGIPCEHLMPSEDAPHEEFEVVCDDFQHRDEADYFIEQFGEPDEDIFGIDRDLDNRPCESLPRMEDTRKVLNRLHRTWRQDAGLGVDLDCGDFQTWDEANAFFIGAGGPASDLHRLDGNNDGVPCESLPGAPD